MAGKKTILRWFVRICIAVVVTAALMLVAVKFWIAPAIIRMEVAAAVNDYWDGWVDIDEVRFNYSAPIVLRGLSLHDRANRKWLNIGTVELTLRDWPGLAPVLTKVKVYGLRGTAHFIDGKLDLPTKPPPEREKRDISKYIDLQEVLLSDVSIDLADELGNSYQPAALKLRFDRAGEKLIASVEPMVASPGWAAPLQDSSIDLASSEFVASLKIDHQMSEDDMRTILKIVRAPRVETAAGGLAVDVKLTGQLDEPNSIAANGTIALSDWQLSTAHSRLVENFNANLQIKTASEISISSNDLRADVCEGSLSGEFAVALQPGPTGRDLKYEGKAQLADVSMQMLNRALTGQMDMQTGLLSGSGKFSGDSGEFEAMQVTDGQILATNVDLAGANPLARLFQSVFKLANINLRRSVGANNIGTKFTIGGAIAKFDSGRASNSIWAIDLERGGKVNLSSINSHEGLLPKHLDLRLVVIPVAMIDEMFDVVLPPVTDLAKKLSSVHVTGPWGKPTISKETIKDLEEGTIELIHTILLSRGRLGPNITGTVDTILNILKDIRKSSEKASGK